MTHTEPGPHIQPQPHVQGTEHTVNLLPEDSIGAPCVHLAEGGCCSGRGYCGHACGDETDEGSSR